MKIVLDIQNGINEEIEVEDDVFEALEAFAKSKNIPIEKCFEIILTEYAKKMESEFEL